nr:hypothetical protein GCM10020092_078220 [Actinoplanes digitatis]
MVRQPHSAEPTAGSVVVYTLLLQDLFAVPTPNGAFWSIGVEALLYGVLPLLLVLCRRFGPAAMLAVVTLPVIVIGFVVFDGSPPKSENWMAPHLVPAFAAGVVAAGVVAAGDRLRRLPWAVLSLLAAIPAGALILHQGSRWMVNHYYWVDLAVVPAMTMLLLAVASGQPAALIRLLDSSPLRRLGSFSYSLYLIHLPIVVAIALKLVAPRLGHGVAAFTVTTVLARRPFADRRVVLRQGLRGAVPLLGGRQDAIRERAPSRRPDTPGSCGRRAPTWFSTARSGPAALQGTLIRAVGACRQPGHQDRQRRQQRHALEHDAPVRGGLQRLAARPPRPSPPG